MLFLGDWLIAPACRTCTRDFLQTSHLLTNHSLIQLPPEYTCLLSQFYPVRRCCAARDTDRTIRTNVDSGREVWLESLCALWVAGDKVFHFENARWDNLFVNLKANPPEVEELCECEWDKD